MLVTNGAKTRNIADKQLSEYEAKGYEALKTAPISAKAASKKTGDK